MNKKVKIMTDTEMFCDKNSIPYQKNLSTKSISTFKIGGVIPLAVFPLNADHAALLIRFFKTNNIKYKTAGNCSNILFSDEKKDYVLIKTDNMNSLVVDKDRIITGAGNLLSKISSTALKSHLSGMENLYGIPGSVGGAVIMNAGAYGSEMSQIVEETEYVDNKGDIRIVSGEAHCFGYRYSCFSDREIVTKTIIKLNSGNYQDIREKMTLVIAKRKASQPLEMPSAGSVFMRPEGYFAGKLIEDCGLKGFSVGDAMVSTKHAGFIVNKGKATSNDVKHLINIIQSQVYDKFGVKLETEIRIF
jgi:UDP-N-acetylmuramate dehydrogenase